MNEITSSFEKTKIATYSKTHNCISISLSDLLYIVTILMIK